jgi:GxxExxY protein
MNADERESLNTLFDAVIGAAYEVSNTLGAGFLEKVYEHALTNELALRGISSRPQGPLPSDVQRSHHR